MKWIAWERANVDRMARPWMVRYFAKLLFILAHRAEERQAIAAEFSKISKHDRDNMAKQFALCDALYPFSKQVDKAITAGRH